jgi:two-component system sensor histidine kinase RegB
VQAATVAHEIGTPLSTIAMLSEELRDAARSDKGLAPYSADLELLEQQMTLCTSALARLRSRASTTTNRQQVGEWLESFGEQWRLRHPHVKFERIGVPPEDVSLDDTVAVSQILTILLDNAARASRDHVTLSCTLASRGDQIVFEICDAGPGIPAALRGSLGVVPVESTQGGHGVGLYLAFSAAARLKGSIELTDVSTIKPRGTRAVLKLPLAGRTFSGKGRQGAAPSNTEKQA